MATYADKAEMLANAQKYEEQTLINTMVDVGGVIPDDILSAPGVLSVLQFLQNHFSGAIQSAQGQGYVAAGTWVNPINWNRVWSNNGITLSGSDIVVDRDGYFKVELNILGTFAAVTWELRVVVDGVEVGHYIPLVGAAAAGQRHTLNLAVLALAGNTIEFRLAHNDLAGQFYTIEAADVFVEQLTAS